MGQVKFFKGYLPQILLGPFLNIVTHIIVSFSEKFLHANVKLLFRIKPKYPKRYFESKFN